MVWFRSFPDLCDDGDGGDGEVIRYSTHFKQQQGLQNWQLLQS
jgi:hypothetical protein